MKEIDQMLNQWIHNSVVRTKLRELIVNAIHGRHENTKTTLDIYGGVEDFPCNYNIDTDPYVCEICEKHMTKEDHDFCDICDKCRDEIEFGR